MKFNLFFLHFIPSVLLLIWVFERKVDDVKCPLISSPYTVQRLFTVNEAIWWAKFGYKNLMATLNRRPERINDCTSVTLITCFIIQWKKSQLVIHERCQWDLGSGEGWDPLSVRNLQVQTANFLFSFPAEADAHLSPSPRVCAFLKIGNKRNGLCLRCSDSS